MNWNPWKSLDIARDTPSKGRYRLLSLSYYHVVQDSYQVDNMPACRPDESAAQRAFSEGLQ